jgi:ferrous iron transport protein B
VDEEIAQPFKIANIEENLAFLTVVTKINDVKQSFKVKSEELEAGSPELAALEIEKEINLKKIETVESVLYGPASRYAVLKGELDEHKDKLAQEQTGEKLGQSYAGRAGKLIEPVIAPVGFDWKMGVGLFAAIAAKEVLVSTLGTIYSVGEADENSMPLKEALAQDPAFNPLIAYSLMVFVLIFSPCLAAIAVIKRETNSWKWALFSSVYSTVLAWVIAFIVYQGGNLIGLGG